jgi:hypothetical protein
MNYLKARQRKSDGKWDYTLENDGVIYPIGYCSAYREPNIPINPDRLKTMRDFSIKHHSEGHSTPEEANQCYKKYLLDQRLTLMQQYIDVQHKCAVCGEFTQCCVSIDGWHKYTLCEKHNNREEVEKLFSVGESWES